MSTTEEKYARQLAGVHNQDAVEKIARHLHYNESLHMHDVGPEDDRDPCVYCWLRAGKAIHALRVAGLPIVLGPDPVQGTEPVEVEAGVLHDLEAAGSRGERIEVQGWTVVHIGAPGAYSSRRVLVFRSQDHRHYGVRGDAFMHADPESRIMCHPATPRPVVTQTPQFLLAEAVAW